MELPVSRTDAGRAGLAALVACPGEALLALDYDGTLAPIVADPARAYLQPGALDVLARVAAAFGALAVVTGRPAAVAAGLAGFDGVPGLERLVVLGLYGADRWDAGTGSVRTPPPHSGVAAARAELFRVVESVRARVGPRLEGVAVEDKDASLAVHTRRAADPDLATDELRGPLAGLAERHGLSFEPGRKVLELRPPGVDKGSALLAYAAECGAGALFYAGDDLGDLAAFDAVERARASGVPGVTVGVKSAEVIAPAQRADLVVAGPAGLLALLAALSDLVR